jgi:ribosome recycling factor
MFDQKKVKDRMEKTIISFKKEIGTLRTGRANSAMLDNIKADVYGQLMPLNQLATITTPEPRMLSIQVWDATNVNIIDSALKKSDLGINPQIDGQIIRIRIPDLTEERRKEMIKVLKTIGEKAKVSIRNIRRDCNEEIKNLEKEKTLSQDESKSIEKNIQKTTDDYIKNIDDLLSSKEQEIIQI